MTDAEKAYEIAEQRITRAKAEGLAYLCLGPHGASDYQAKWDSENALKHLATIPPSIASLTDLKKLDLDDTQVTDLSPLAGMVAMQWLNLNNTQVADLSPLAGMVAIQELYLNSTQVTDLSPLTGMVAMQTLRLNNTQVTDLSPLAGMVAMQTLTLDNTQVTDLSPLAGMVAMPTLTLDNTQVTDLSPLAGMVAMQTLWLNRTQAELASLVAPGAAWEHGNRELFDIEFREVPVEDEVLAEIGRSRGNAAPRTLARLRELRDMASAPAAPQGREDGAKLDLDEHGALALSDPALGDEVQDDLSEELQDACAALSASLATSNQFAHTRGRSDRLMRLLANPTAETGAERAWALVNALRDDHEGHLAAEKANDAGEIGAAEAMLPPMAAPKLATVARIAGVWLMGFPGAAEVERKYAEYETGKRDEDSVVDAETLLNDVSPDMTDEATTFAQDLLAAAKHGTRAGGRAAKAVGAFAYNTAAFLIRSAYRVGKVVKGTLEFSAVVGIPSVAYLLAHEAAVTAWVAAQAPGMMPALRFVLDGLRAIGL